MKAALRAICLLLLCGLLTVGLWPFGRPRNGVGWTENGNGLRLRRYSAVFSSGAIAAKTRGSSACSIEIWLRPTGTGRGATTILSLYDSTKGAQFSLRQSLSDLVLRSVAGSKQSELYADDILYSGKSAYLTVTSSSRGTAVYLNGKPVKLWPEQRCSLANLEGLVLGNSLRQHDSWHGDVRGLAIYDAQLDGSSVERHYQSWMAQGRPEAAAGDHAIAVYLFGEGKGNVVHNDLSVGPSLEIPDQYRVLNEFLLDLPWREFRPDKAYWLDVIVNIVGFVPYGFFVCSYLCLAEKWGQGPLVTVLIGFATSLTIEILQSHLPTRDSSTTDVITNTLGTAIGVKVCALVASRVRNVSKLLDSNTQKLNTGNSTARTDLG